MLQNTIAIPPATIVKVAETISNVQFPFPLIPRNPVMEAAISSGKNDQFHAFTFKSS